MMYRLEKLVHIKQPLGFACLSPFICLNGQVGFSQTSSPANGNWPQFRGPTRDSISSETGLLKEWPTAGPSFLRKFDGLGQG
jgi:hypothetical protein